MLEKPTTPVPNYSEDEGIRCLQCDYNLTGLPSGRCPECGNPFDREALLNHYGGAVAPLPIWDDRDETGFLAAFFSTIAAVCFTPRRYFRRMPSNPDRDSARKFSQSCFLATAALCLLPALLGMRWLIGLIPAIIGWLTAAWFFQLAITTILFGEVEAVTQDNALSKNPREVCCCMLSAHLPVLTAAVMLSALILAVGPRNATMAQFALQVSPILASALLFVRCIVELFVKFKTKLREAVLGLVLIPVLLFTAAVIGAAAAFVLTFAVGILLSGP